MAGVTMTLGDLKREIACAEEVNGFTDDTPVAIWDRVEEVFHPLAEAVQETVMGKMLELHTDGNKDLNIETMEVSA